MRRYGTTLGATLLDNNQCAFLVWAPFAGEVAVHIHAPRNRTVPLEPLPHGYYYAVVDQVEAGTLYTYILDSRKERPDPASRLQPDGVHGPSQVIEPRFLWSDQSWHGPLLRDYILYELHVGTFTQEGTFEAVIPHLDHLVDLGITALELMPMAQFPGNRNWGYDGVYPFAVQNSYGGPHALKRLVDACHRRGLAVVLDVVYNHLGPEGNYFGDFGPYFTDRYRTPWGAAINFDGPHSDEVRTFFIENALRWVTEFHIDGLRLDAIDGIFDFSSRPFLQELASVVHDRAERLNRRIYLFAECALNDSRIIRSSEQGGYGLDALWNDEFHHALHTLFTGEQAGYYKDFCGFPHLVRAFREGFVYSGQFSLFRMKRHGNSSRDLPGHKLVVFAQNHDQVGNRMKSDRLSLSIDAEKLKLAAGAVLLSPFTPLLFMGEEYGETAPFPYFVSHSDEALIEAVRKGRREEFSEFLQSGNIPDPQDEATFVSAMLNRHFHSSENQRTIYEFYQELIRLRKELITPAEETSPCREVSGYDREKVLLVTYRNDHMKTAVIFHFGEEPISLALPFEADRWIRRIDSADKRWRGPGCFTPTEITLSDDTYYTLALAASSIIVFTTREDT